MRDKPAPLRRIIDGLRGRIDISLFYESAVAITLTDDSQVFFLADQAGGLVACVATSDAKPELIDMLTPELKSLNLPLVQMPPGGAKASLIDMKNMLRETATLQQNYKPPASPYQ